MQVSLGLASQAVLVTSDTSQPGVMSLTTNPYPVELRSRTRGRLYFFAAQRFEVRPGTGDLAGQWKVRTLGYAYSLGDSDHPDDALVHWHWHPPMRAGPHIHVLSVDPLVTEVQEGVRGHHLPSGRVSIEAIVRHLITDCGVGGRDGWDAVLRENDELFTRFRTWS